MSVIKLYEVPFGFQFTMANKEARGSRVYVHVRGDGMFPKVSWRDGEGNTGEGIMHIGTEVYRYGS